MNTVKISKTKNLYLKTLTITMLFFFSASQVLAVPTYPSLRQQIEEKQRTYEEVKAELVKLNEQLEIAIEEYNAARERLEEIQMDLTNVKLEHAHVQQQHGKQKEIFYQRIRNIYKKGDKRFLEIILNTTNFFDFFTTLHFAVSLTEQDQKILRNLKEVQKELEKSQERLEEKISEETALKEEIEARKLEIQNQLLEKQRYIESLSDEIKALLAEEEARQAQERENIKETVNKLFEELGIIVEPGSVVETALHYLGVPYVWGGESPDIGFDCSGLVKFVFQLHGVELPHYSRAQAKMGEPVERIEDLRPGDLVFFGNPVHHVGIYVEKGYFIHAPQTGDFVRLGKLSERPDFSGARRIPAPPRVFPIIPSPLTTTSTTQSF